MKRLTIFTPAYNRAHLLPRLYESLKKQTSQDFVWMVIDDGSTDDTQSLIHSYIAESVLDIKYIYQDNQGMHGAHNTAYENIKTELNTCIDSDDFMPEDAVEVILNKWESISTQDRSKYSGIVGLDADMQGNIIGSKFKSASTTLEGFYLNGGSGDKKLVYRTDVMNSYPPYPLFKNEKYVGLSYKYLLADQDYELSTINHVLVIVDYQKGGSSNNMFRQYYKNPKGFAFLRKQGMVLSKSRKRRLLDAVHYVASSFISQNLKFIKESPKKMLTILAIPAGFLLYVLIRFKNIKQKHTKEL